ncbi:aminotransferase [Bacillus coahuilensis p1.1.43]|uniref:Aminotransferase n=1 Tax=Bacillus coahuilensis p1.1.43 TaxID=1150625 RepID=A0A147KAU8_9BACI|nr:pyridoxal phosphate-dependent aminotransferase [Bacillus coahuilensis]KUP07855.1 aminotransferase [Bacillus coahuilensis p1.1.43]
MNSFKPSKTIQDLPTQFFARLVSNVQQITALGYDVINLGQGNPDLPTPPHIVKSMQEAVARPENHKYSPFRGHTYLKQAIAEFYKREYDVLVDPNNEVAILFGGKAGLVEVSQCILNPGEIALVPDPGYPDYLSGLALAGARMKEMPLLEQNNFLPNYNEIDEETLKHAKVMFLNYPNNPTGAIASEDFYIETADFAKRHELCVIHDFAYGAISFDNQKHRSFLQTEGAKECGIEIYTLSKTYNMAGWRVAFAVGNSDIISSIELLQDHLHVSLFGAIQEAATTALLGSQVCVSELVRTYESRRNVLVNGLRDIGWDVTSPSGSFFAWLRIPKGYTSESFSEFLLKEAHVVVAPGIGFGSYGEGYVRVGLLATEDRLLEAVHRIKALNIF